MFNLAELDYNTIEKKWQEKYKRIPALLRSKLRDKAISYENKIFGGM